MPLRPIPANFVLLCLLLINYTLYLLYVILCINIKLNKYVNKNNPVVIQLVVKGITIGIMYYYYVFNQVINK